MMVLLTKFESYLNHMLELYFLSWEMGFGRCRKAGTEYPDVQITFSCSHFFRNQSRIFGLAWKSQAWLDLAWQGQGLA